MVCAAPGVGFRTDLTAQTRGRGPIVPAVAWGAGEHLQIHQEHPYSAAVAVISRSRGYLFLLAPRTASTALAHGVLFPHLDGEWIPPEHVLDERGRIVVGRKHTTVPELVRAGLLTRAEARGLFTFCAVRNPFDSLVSHYVKLRTQRRQEAATDPGSWVNRQPGALRSVETASELSFSEWLRERYVGTGSWRHPWWKLRHRTAPPHHLYGPYVRDSDEILRFEHLQEDFDRIAGRLGATGPLEIPRVNATAARDRDYREYYDDGSRRLVETLFAPDLERFGYRF